MHIRIDVHHHGLSVDRHAEDRIVKAIAALIKLQGAAMSKVSDALVQLTADVEAEGAVVDSAVAAINGLPAVAAAAVAAADSAVSGQTAKLTAALTANTPAAPPA